MYYFPQLPLELKSYSSQGHNLSPRSGIHSFIASNSNSNKVTECNISTLWHHRLGHANLNFVASILKLCNVVSSNKNNHIFCSACNLGKAHRLFAPLTHTIYRKPFDMIYTDLWDPSPSPYSSGFSYYIAFVDGHSKYIWLYLLRLKS